MSFRHNKDKNKTEDEDVKVVTEEKSKKAATKEDASKSSSSTSGDSGVPDGTTAEILQWVGDDKEKAQAALDKENADEKPRKGLTGELEEILTEPEDEAEVEGGDAETEDETAQ